LQQVKQAYVSDKYQVKVFEYEIAVVNWCAF